MPDLAETGDTPETKEKIEQYTNALIARASKLLPAIGVDTPTFAQEIDESITTFVLLDANRLDYPFALSIIDGKIVIEQICILKGVRTFPNGDPGYPDDIDVIAVKEFPIGEYNQAAFEYVEVIARFLLQVRLEQIIDDALADEWRQTHPNESLD